MASPVPRVSVPDQVFTQLREAILLGRYSPGERLPPQRALAAKFEVNMASVREALKRLEQLRLVRVRHGDATRVLDWRRSGGLESIVLGEGPTPEPFLRDLLEARRLLLVEAARFAAARRSDEQAEALERLAAAVGTAEELEERQRADWAFMAALVEAAGNLVFQLIMNSVRELYLQRSEAFAALFADRDATTELYGRAASAITARESEEAARAIEALASAQAGGLLR